MELVAGFGIGPGLLAHEVDCSLIELAELIGGLDVETTPRDHGLRAAFLERRVIEEGVRPGVQDLMTERRRLGRIPRDQRELSRFHPFENPFQPREVHRLE